MTTNTTLDIKGNLLRHTPAEILIEAMQSKLSGSLRFSSKAQKAIVYVESGKVAFAVSNMREHRFFQLLLDENVISKQELLKLENITNDLFLAKNLVDNNYFRKEDVSKFLQLQTSRIIKTILEWETGEWIFSPLARVQRSLKLPININPILYKYANKIEKQKILGRFKTLEEVFYANKPGKENSFDQISLDSQEAYILSRLGTDKLEIKEIQSISGLPNNELFIVLYKLWLGGLVSRRNWNSPFNESDLAKISSAKYFLKQSAMSVEEAELERLEKEEQAKQEKFEIERKAIEDEKQKERISLEKYLRQVENATTHYELFGVDPEAEIKEIKTIYFSIAKKFHPDIYHKKVDKVLHQRIQSAFTEIAEAYDTLKDEESREVYNFRLRKAIEALKQQTDEADKSGTNDKPEKNSGSDENHGIATESFDIGYNFLMEDQFAEAIPFLARAVQLNSSNARYHAFYGKALSFNSNQYRKAAAELKEAVTLDPRKSVYRLMLAEIYEKIGLLTNARGELKRLLEFDPNNQDALSLLKMLDNK